MTARTLAFAITFLTCASGQAATWFMSLDCTPDDTNRFARVVTLTEAFIRATDRYAQRMTGAPKNSYNYEYWFALWTGPFPAIVQTSAAKLASDIQRSAFLIYCHDQGNVCDGTNAAYTSFVSPEIHLCDIAWEFTDEEMAIFLVHELSHYLLGADDFGMRGPGDARLLVLSGSLLNPAAWWITTRASYNWQFFIGSSAGMACDVGGGRSSSPLVAGTLGFVLIAIFCRRSRKGGIK